MSLFHASDDLLAVSISKEQTPGCFMALIALVIRAACGLISGQLLPSENEYGSYSPEDSVEAAGLDRSS
jgi:hypothetical protein